MEGPGRRAAIIVAVVALAAGAAGFLAALGDPFLHPQGSLLGKLLHFNQLGALVTVVLAAIALVGAATRRSALSLAAGSGFALCAILTIVQTGRDPNWLGGRGNTLSLFMACALGLVVMTLAPTEARQEEQGDVSTDTLRA